MKNKIFIIILLAGALLASACSSKKEESSSIIEIICNDSINPNLNDLSEILSKQSNHSGVYRWKNRLVIYGDFVDTKNIQKEIETHNPGTTVQIYDKPFYTFNREMCDNKGTAKKWKHIIMSANLVEDTAMQQEYMDYHASQFEKWPEVSKGFCSADFQQVLVFRNGRQLMLVISIPEGKTLDELNPKTTENNPRVVEWNKIMSKYQTGITGTNPGETWVVLEPEK